MISLIAAIGAKNELGYGNDLIWKIKDDLARFKSITSGHPIIMGRKTFESIGRVLPNRTNIIVSHDPGLEIDGAKVATSIEQGLEIARSEKGADEVFIIGGAQIFEQAIKFADKLYLTKVNSEAPMADTFFPDYSEFTKETFREAHEDDGLEYVFINLEKG